MTMPGSGRRPVTYQAQAVLRRPDQQAPLRLVGVLVEGAFYPATVQDAWGPLNVKSGLVALAPLDPVETAGTEQAAALALRQATLDWTDGHSPDGLATLRWRPIRDVRVPADGRPIAELIGRMASANDERESATPSTPPYHDAARKLEDLASLVYDTARTEERAAEEGARDRAQAASDRSDPSVKVRPESV